MPLLMLVIIMTAAFGTIMMSTMLSATHTTDTAQGRLLALNAAQSGVNAMVGQIRAADSNTNSTVGDSSRLPCTGVSSGAGTASINSGVAPSASNSGTSSYSVSVAYYDVNPATLGTSDLTAQRMLCTSAGTFNPTLNIRTPRFALITSIGSYSYGTQASTRELQTTYNFQVLNNNIPGGQIALISNGSSTSYCMDAGSNPAVGTPVYVQPCSSTNPPVASQVWEYRPDLSIELVSSVTNPNSAGLCMDTGASPTVHAVGNPIVLEQCGVADSAVCPSGYTPSSYHTKYPSLTCSTSPWNQQWSLNDSGALQAADPPSSATSTNDLDTECMDAASQTAGVALTLQTCSGNGGDTTQALVMSPSVGAGMASAATSQLVNFQFFSQCLDDTNQNPTWPYMILYNCKQDPNAGLIRWNQKFGTAPALGVAPTQVLITVYDTANSTQYCLQSPQTVGGYPVLVVQGSGTGQCPASVSAAGANSPFVWTVSQFYSNSAGTTALSYANQYTITDSSATPLCLSSGNSSDLYAQFYKAVVTTCDGSNRQKWNAAASTTQASLTNTSEISTGS